jgi:uncharacterized membrane protein
MLKKRNSIIVAISILIYLIITYKAIALLGDGKKERSDQYFNIVIIYTIIGCVFIFRYCYRLFKK